MTVSSPGRHRFGRLVLALTLGFAVTATGLPDRAAAQERPRNLLDMLFGGPSRARPSARVYQEAPPPRRVIRRAPQRKAAPAENRNRRNSTRSVTTAGAAAATAAVVAVEKAENARPVLVVGDFMASSLAKGLEAAFAQNRDIRVVAEADGSSGLVRDDHKDWPGDIAGLIETAKPAAVVVMLGANDRQAIRGAEGSIPLRSTEWARLYEERARELAGAIRGKNVPLLWVGQPAFGSDRASEDMVYLNDLYRNVALGVGGEYVDIWGGFADANGAFVSSGPDMAGQTVRLRNSDGITLTPAGQEKLVYFVEKPVTKVLGLNVGDFVASLGSQQLSAADLPTAVDAALATSTPPVSFADPRLDGGDQLLGGAAPAAAGKGSPREQLVTQGLVAQASEGRADQFNWTGRGTAVSPITHDNAIVFRGTTSLEELRLHPPASPQATPPSPEPQAGTPDQSAVN